VVKEARWNSTGGSEKISREWYTGEDGELFGTNTSGGGFLSAHETERERQDILASNTPDSYGSGRIHRLQRTKDEGVSWIE
jgi:hypothetical protein